MFKLCLDCLFGNGAPNEDVYGTANGQALGNMSHKNNEMIFRLPRPLNYGDVFEVKGEMKSNPERLCIALSAGTYNIDHNNVACEIDARFMDEDNVRTRTILDGVEEEEHIKFIKASDIFQTAHFTIRFTIRYISDITMLSIEIDASHLADITLKHGLQDIAFLSFSDDILQVKELNFTFSN